MRARRTLSVVASASAISALIDRNSACNYYARFERTREDRQRIFSQIFARTMKQFYVALCGRKHSRVNELFNVKNY